MGTSVSTLGPQSAASHRAIKTTFTAMAVALMLIPVSISVHAGLYDSFVDSALTGWGMWGNFVIHMWTRPRRKECAATIGLGILMRLTYDLSVGERGYPGSLIIGMGTFLGLASLAVLAVRSILPGERRAVSRRSLGVIALFSYIGVCLGFYISFAKMALPRKYDYFLYAFDSSLGFLPSFAAAKLVRSWAPLSWTVVMIYNCLGFWFSLVYAVHANAGKKYPLKILKILVANAFIGFSLYFCFPAMGPKYAFPSFPDAPGVVHPVTVLLSGVPNAMPSLHFGGTLLIFWLAKPWKWLYRITGAVAALTALATIGLGEHYLVDLVVAVPYTLAILAFGSDVPQRRPALLGGAGMVIAWFAILHSTTYLAAVSWGLIAATLVVAVFLERRLAQGLFEPAPAEACAQLCVPGGPAPQELTVETISD